MNYVVLVRSDGVPAPEKTRAMNEHLSAYLDVVTAGDRYIYGHRLDLPGTARTVRVRDGQTLVSDGPFAEAKEFVAGFDVLAMADRAEAIATAAQHPVSRFHSLELWPVVSDHDGAVTRPPAPGLFTGPPEGSRRFLLFLCDDGVPESHRAGAATAAAARAWTDRAQADGLAPYAVALSPPRSVTTVRVRDGRTLASDGPSVAATEFPAGLVVVDVANLDDAVTLAGEHPVARSHRIEVRPFLED